MATVRVVETGWRQSVLVDAGAAQLDAVQAHASSHLPRLSKMLFIQIDRCNRRGLFGCHSSRLIAQAGFEKQFPCVWTVDFTGQPQPVAVKVGLSESGPNPALGNGGN